MNTPEESYNPSGAKIFVTEDTSAGDETALVVLARVCDTLLAITIILLTIVLAHAALSMIVGRWL